MTDTTRNNNSGGGFLTGLLIGLILGGGLVFLLATDKGKKLLKFITDEGSDKLSDISEFLEELSDIDDQDVEVERYEEEEQPVLPAKSLKKPVVNAYTKPVDMVHPEPVPTTSTVSVVQQTSSTTKPRRFFRGVPKRG